MRIDVPATGPADDRQTLCADKRRLLDRGTGVGEGIFKTPAIGAGETSGPRQARHAHPQLAQEIGCPFFAEGAQLRTPQADRPKTLAMISEKFIVEVPGKRRQMIDREPHHAGALGLLMELLLRFGLRQCRLLDHDSCLQCFAAARPGPGFPVPSDPFHNWPWPDRSWRCRSCPVRTRDRFEFLRV